MSQTIDEVFKGDNTIKVDLEKATITIRKAALSAVTAENEQVAKDIALRTYHLTKAIGDQLTDEEGEIAVDADLFKAVSEDAENAQNSSSPMTEIMGDLEKKLKPQKQEDMDEESEKEEEEEEKNKGNVKKNVWDRDLNSEDEDDSESWGDDPDFTK